MNKLEKIGLMVFIFGIATAIDLGPNIFSTLIVALGGSLFFNGDGWNE